MTLWLLDALSCRVGGDYDRPTVPRIAHTHDSVGQRLAYLSGMTTLVDVTSEVVLLAIRRRRRGRLDQLTEAGRQSV